MHYYPYKLSKEVFGTDVSRYSECMFCRPVIQINDAAASALAILHI